MTAFTSSTPAAVSTVTTYTAIRLSRPGISGSQP